MIVDQFEFWKVLFISTSDISTLSLYFTLGFLNSLGDYAKSALLLILKSADCSLWNEPLEFICVWPKTQKGDSYAFFWNFWLPKLLGCVGLWWFIAGFSLLLFRFELWIDSFIKILTDSPALKKEVSPLTALSSHRANEFTVRLGGWFLDFKWFTVNS